MAHAKDKRSKSYDAEETREETAARREQLIQDLREYREMQENATTQVDRRSLDVAAEVVALFENRDLGGNPLDRRWQDEIPAPKPSRRRAGRVTNPDSFNQFTKWAEGVTGLKHTQLNCLKQADHLASIIVSAGGDNSPSGERSLRPLKFLSREGREDEIPKVWAAASQLAHDDGRDVPTETHAKRALKDWKDANLPKAEGGTVTPIRGGSRAKVRKAVEEVERWLYQEPTMTAPLLRKLLAKYEAENAAIPPVSEWSS